VDALEDLVANGMEVALEGLARVEGGYPGQRDARRNLHVLAVVARSAHEKRHERGCPGLEPAHTHPDFSSRIGLAFCHDHDLAPALDVLSTWK
jgi:hypothetical protein